MSNWIPAVLLVGVALGFYCAGRLHGALWVTREVERIFNHGYRLGRDHGAASKAAHAEGMEILAELGAEIRRGK